MTLLRGRGIQLELPDGWDAHIYRREPDPPEQTFSVMHVANFPLPASMGDYGGGAVQIMRGSHLLMCLLETDPRQAGDPLFSTLGPPRSIALSVYDRTTLQRGLPGQVGAQRFFNAASRAWVLFVVLGNAAFADLLAPQVDAVLATLEIGPLP